MTGYIWGAITECEDHIYSLRSIFAGIKEEAEKERIARIQAQKELAALREKYRWRKQSEEPAPKDEKVEVATIGMFGGTCCIRASGALLDLDSLKVCYWRPLDLPEDAHHA